MRSHGHNRKPDFERSLDQVRKFIAAGNIEAAERLTRKVTNREHNNTEVMFLNGCIEYKKGNNANAIDLFEAVVKKDPEHIGARLNLAVALNDANQNERAAELIEDVVARQPRHFIAYYNLGNVYRLQNRMEDAKAAYLKSIEINPNYDVVYNNLGVTCNALKQTEEAIRYFRKGVSLNHDPDTYTQLISLLKRKNYLEAYALALQIIKLPNPANALVSAFPVFVDCCSWDILKDVEQKTLDIAKSPNVIYGALQDIFLSLNARPHINPVDVFELHRKWGRMITNNAQQFREYSCAKNSPEKLKVAYLSSDFRAHSVGLFIRNIIKEHDPDRFEIVCYSRTDAGDHVTEEIKTAASRYIDVSDLDDWPLAERIHNDGIHILIDLAGHTTGTGLPAMRYKPAPVQITYLGYPNTTGLPTMDYRITDDYAENAEGTRYTEKLLKMPQSFLCFGKFEERPQNIIPPVVNNGYITFASFNNIRKLTPQVVHAWSQILIRVPGSKLIIKAGKANLDVARKNIFNEFAKYGIDEQRVDLRGHINAKEVHLDFYNQVDIALDTFPYNGTTTTCEALWMGVPVITLVGKVHAQRVSYSILKNIDIENTITYSEKEYIDRAVSLAKNIEELTGLREKIPVALRKSILCNTSKFVRQLEDVYITAWNDKGYKSFRDASRIKGGKHDIKDRVDINNELNRVKVNLENGNLVEADDLITRIVDKHPENIDAQFMLGTIENQKGNYNAGIEILNDVIKKNPTSLNARLNLGVAYTETNQLDEALQQYNKIIEQDPHNYMALSNIGRVYHKLNRFDDAFSVLRKSIANNSNYWISYFNLGSVYSSINDYINATKCYRKAFEIEKHSDIYACLISAIKRTGDLDESYRLAIEYIDNKILDESLLSICTIFFDTCSWDIEKKIYKEIIAIAHEPATRPRYLSSVLLALNGRNYVSAKESYDLHCLWGENISKQCAPFQDYKAALSNTDKLRIGYVSSDFNIHSVGFFIKNILETHDREEYEIYCYSNSDIEDSVTRDIKLSVNSFAKVRWLTDYELATKIHNDGIQILVDLSGHTAMTRLPVFRYKPAPIQMTYLGYPNTSGLSAIDYRITDSYADPGNDCYVEKLLYMPESFLCFGKFEERVIETLPAVSRNKYITFGSFNNLRKLTPDVINVWSEILKQVPDSKLIIKASNADHQIARNNILAEFAKNGIDNQRINMRGFSVSIQSHLDLYKQIDIALDTFPYNGTTTTCEALWMGVPVLTLVGTTHAQRVSYSILKNIGIEDTIANTKKEYIECAVTLSNNIELLSSLHLKVAQAIRNSILCNPEKFTRQLEGLYKSAWDRTGLDCSVTADNVENVKPGYENRIVQPGIWTEYLQNFTYINPFLNGWLGFVEENRNNQPWLIHQQALDYFVYSKLTELMPTEKKGYLEKAFQLLFKLVSTDANISNLQTFTRISAELGRNDVAIATLNYLINLANDYSQCNLVEPFLPVLEGYQKINPQSDYMGWMNSAFGELEKSLLHTHVRHTVVQEKPTIRILHNMARAGGTLISKCLGCMDKVVLLSEIHPQGAEHFNPIMQAHQWFHLFSEDDMHELGIKGKLEFSDAIRLIENKCHSKEEFLVIRDWAHLDFTAVPFVSEPSYTLATADVLRDQFNVLQAAITRHPLDQWLSLRRLAVINGNLSLEYYLQGYLKYAEHCVKIGFIRYEDFVKSPERSMNELCRMLEVPYDGDFIKHWWEYKTITGDVTSDRGGNEIKEVPRRHVEEELIKKLMINEDYLKAIDILGYS